jgi:hypothetical protein
MSGDRIRAKNCRHNFLKGTNSDGCSIQYALCWLHGTSVRKSWGHVPRRSIFPICIVFTKKYLCVKKIVSCPREENRATKTKRTLVLKRLWLLHSIKSPPLSLGAHDFYDSCCSHAIFHVMAEGSRSIHHAPVLATWHIRSQNSSLRLLLLAICLACETRERDKQGCSSRSSREKPQAYEKNRRLENALRKDMPKMGQRASTGIFAHSSVSDHCPVDSV